MDINIFLSTKYLPLGIRIIVPRSELASKFCNNYKLSLIFKTLTFFCFRSVSTKWAVFKIVNWISNDNDVIMPGLSIWPFLLILSYLRLFLEVTENIHTDTHHWGIFYYRYLRLLLEVDSLYLEEMEEGGVLEADILPGHVRPAGALLKHKY